MQFSLLIPHYDHDGGLFRGIKPDWMCETPFYQDPKEYEIDKFEVKGLIGKHSRPLRQRVRPNEYNLEDQGEWDRLGSLGR